MPKTGILVNLALSELYANHPVDAIGHFETYLADPGAPAEKRERALRSLDEAMKKTGHLTIKSTPGSEIRIDGKAAAVGKVHLMPGPHSLEAKRGDKQKAVTIDLQAGAAKDVDLSFDLPSPTPATIPSLDAPPPTDPPPAVESKEGSNAPRNIVAGTLAVVGLAGLGVAVMFTLKANTSSDDLTVTRTTTGGDSGCVTASPTCDARYKAADDLAKNTNIARVMYVVGGVALVGGAVTFLIWPKAKHVAVSGGLSPWVGAGTAGINFTRDF